MTPTEAYVVWPWRPHVLFSTTPKYWAWYSGQPPAIPPPRAADELASPSRRAPGARMPSLRVYAHHGAPPSAFTAATPSTTSTPPPTPKPVAEYWCELVDQPTIDAPGGASPGYGQAGAVAPDQWRFDLGYAAGAVDFSVTGLCVLLVDTTQNSYDYVLVSPSGQVIPVPAVVVFGPMTPMSAWGNPAAPFGGSQGCWNQIPTIASARGIWRIQLFQKPGFFGLPTDAFWANGVSHVQLYNSPVEGILAVQFTGVEVLPTTTTTTTSTTTSTTSTTTSGPTTTSTTTSGPGGTTTSTTTAGPGGTTSSTTTTSTSTTNTTAAPPVGGPGCLCMAAVILALILVAATAIMLFTWACGGFFSV